MAPSRIQKSYDFTIYLYFVDFFPEKFSKRLFDIFTFSYLAKYSESISEKLPDHYTFLYARKYIKILHSIGLL